MRRKQRLYITIDPFIRLKLEELAREQNTSKSHCIEMLIAKSKTTCITDNVNTYDLQTYL